MRTRLIWILTMAGTLAAQQVVAPTPEQPGPAGGQDVGNYNVTDSFETGYRFAEIGGDLGKYRSDVNFRNGIRLLGSSLTVDSKDGHGGLFDHLLLTTQGLGNDPYQSANLRVEKNSLYRYDLMWRLDEFYNPGVAISGGLHQMDTRRRLQDHDLTILPQSKIKFRAGYSRNTQTGPALSSVQEFDALGNQYPLFMDVRREWNEYRLGADVELAGFKFTLLRRWDFYKDDSPITGVATLAPLQQFTRSEPYHGSNPGWLGDLVTTHKYWAINARMTYTGGRRDFAMDEAALGLNLGAAASRQILVSGNADRPAAAGDFNLSLFPTDRLTIVNNTSVHNFRTVGDSTYTEFDNATGLGSSLNFRYLGVRTVANATDLNFRVTKWLGIYGGYHYSDRLITTIEGFASPPDSGIQSAEYLRNNHMNTGTLGVRVQPVRPLTINLEGEIGRDNKPFTPISEDNYHTIGGRVQYRTRKVQVSGQYRQVYNINAPFSLSEFSSHSRNYTANASWSPKDWFSIDASYMKLHSDIASGLVFFAAFQLQQTPTIYLSNVHAANLGAHFGLAKRADLYLGYSITKDTGDGRGTPIQPGIIDPVQGLLSSVETFPLSFQSPLARLSIRLSEKFRWNAGYQFYDYHEDFGLPVYSTIRPPGFRRQNYRANTGYTSIAWSF
ncbi:MAG TPA: hypothetical protein VKT49_00110 [Bryobacteraceae bacterium]|nr:hypothetical protein [Bryobacteraceae bacterium]